jgi:hypothetical protein
LLFYDLDFPGIFSPVLDSPLQTCFYYVAPAKIKVGGIEGKRDGEK